MTRVRVQQRVSVCIGGNTLSLFPGDELDMPENQARELVRAGYAGVLNCNPPPPVVMPAPPPAAIPTPEPIPAPKPADPTPREGVAAIIVNYNMPERADALAEYIKAHC